MRHLTLQTNLSNTSPKEFARRVASLYKQHCDGIVAKQPELHSAAERLGISLFDVAHYTAALAQWTVAGFPAREQEEVSRIERELCRPCEKYVDGRCKTCGCRVTASSLAVVNKIKMATEHCPLEKW